MRACTRWNHQLGSVTKMILFITEALASQQLTLLIQALQRKTLTEGLAQSEELVASMTVALFG